MERCPLNFVITMARPQGKEGGDGNTKSGTLRLHFNVVNRSSSPDLSDNPYHINPEPGRSTTSRYGQKTFDLDPSAYPVYPPLHPFRRARCGQGDLWDRGREPL